LEKLSVKRFIGFGVLASYWLLTVSLAVALPQDGRAKDEVNVLFIGNSYTYFHDMPKMVAELAKAGKQRPLHFERETPGGVSFEKHWKDGKALTKIQARKWDFVVLQEQSQAPLTKRDSMFEYAKKLDAEIKKQGGKSILYMTWATQNKPDNQATITKAYIDLGKDLKALVAPVGNAWAEAMKADMKLVLHENDKSHPNTTGSYLAACVIYATVYNKSPEGLPGSIGGLTDDQAKPLQAAAWKAVQDQRAGEPPIGNGRTVARFCMDKYLEPGASLFLTRGRLGFLAPAYSAW
jgi:hypothetical protein